MAALQLKANKTHMFKVQGSFLPTVERVNCCKTILNIRATLGIIF